MIKLPSTFFKVIKDGVEDCTSPIQLRALLNKYTNFIISDEIFTLFKDRLLVIGSAKKCDFLMTAICADLDEDMDDILIKMNKHKRVISDAKVTKNFFPLCESYNANEKSFLTVVLTITNGNADEVVKILKTNKATVERKIAFYGLKRYINRKRSESRGKQA